MLTPLLSNLSCTKATLIHAFNPDMKPLLAELGNHLNETDMTESRNILVELEGRIRRFRKAGG